MPRERSTGIAALHVEPGRGTVECAFKHLIDVFRAIDDCPNRRARFFETAETLFARAPNAVAVGVRDEPTPVAAFGACLHNVVFTPAPFLGGVALRGAGAEWHAVGSFTLVCAVQSALPAVVAVDLYPAAIGVLLADDGGLVFTDSWSIAGA
ncbi:MAG: hypothetical protein ACJAYU_000402 [Bradymonadia bacterium]|jgi:hypothetical protein